MCKSVYAYTNESVLWVQHIKCGTLTQVSVQKISLKKKKTTFDGSEY